jgi:hypothetical protein
MRRVTSSRSLSLILIISSEVAPNGTKEFYFRVRMMGLQRILILKSDKFEEIYGKTGRINKDETQKIY